MPFIQIQGGRALSSEQTHKIVSSVAQATADSLQVPLERITVTWVPVTAGFVAGQLRAVEDTVVVTALIKEGRSIALKQAMLHAIQNCLADVLQISPNLIKVLTIDLLDGSFL